jgi:hypothetical protein
MEDLRVIASRLSLTNEQATLFASLHRRSERIAQMYVGAVIALKDGADPEQLCKAAYEMRELMEKISDLVDVETPTLEESLTSKVNELEKEFASMTAATKLKSPTWDGAVDMALRKFLGKVEEFLAWKSKHRPQRSDAFTRTLRALDGPGRILPADIEKKAVQSWMKVKEFFDNVAHHRLHPTEEVFREKVAYVEILLLNKLNPKTFADFDQVDAIINQGEQK